MCERSFFIIRIGLMSTYAVAEKASQKRNRSGFLIHSQSHNIHEMQAHCKWRAVVTLNVIMGYPRKKQSEPKDYKPIKYFLNIC